MGNYKQPAKRRRVEVPIPSGRAPHQRRAPRTNYQHHRDGTNQALIDAGVIVITTLLTTVLLLAISGQISDTTNADLIAQSPAPLAGGSIPIHSTPQPSLVIPTPSTQPKHSVATPSPEKEPSPASTPDDTEIQADIDKKLGSDDSLAALGITATVGDGKVILVGTAPSEELKQRVEKLVRAVKGVRQIDNQIAVITNG